MVAKGFENGLQLLCQMRSVSSWFTSDFSGEKSCRCFSTQIWSLPFNPVLAAAEIYGQRKSQISPSGCPVVPSDWRQLPCGWKGFSQCPAAYSCGDLSAPVCQQLLKPGSHKRPMPPATFRRSPDCSSRWYPPGDSSSHLCRLGCVGPGCPDHKLSGTSAPSVRLVLMGEWSA